MILHDFTWFHKNRQGIASNFDTILAVRLRLVQMALWWSTRGHPPQNLYKATSSPDFRASNTIQFQAIYFWVNSSGTSSRSTPAQFPFIYNTISFHVSNLGIFLCPTATDTTPLVNDPGSILFHHDYPTRALITRLEMRSMRTPRSASIHKLRLQWCRQPGILQMRSLQSLPGCLPLHHARS